MQSWHSGAVDSQTSKQVKDQIIVKDSVVPLPIIAKLNKVAHTSAEESVTCVGYTSPFGRPPGMELADCSTACSWTTSIAEADVCSPMVLFEETGHRHIVSSCTQTEFVSTYSAGLGGREVDSVPLHGRDAEIQTEWCGTRIDRVQRKLAEACSREDVLEEKLQVAIRQCHALRCERHDVVRQVIEFAIENSKLVLEQCKASTERLEAQVSRQKLFLEAAINTDEIGCEPLLPAPSKPSTPGPEPLADCGQDVQPCEVSKQAAIETTARPTSSPFGSIDRVSTWTLSVKGKTDLVAFTKACHAFGVSPDKYRTGKDWSLVEFRSTKTTAALVKGKLLEAGHTVSLHSPRVPIGKNSKGGVVFNEDDEGPIFRPAALGGGAGFLGSFTCEKFLGGARKALGDGEEEGADKQVRNSKTKGTRKIADTPKSCEDVQDHEPDEDWWPPEPSQHEHHHVHEHFWNEGQDNAFDPWSEGVWQDDGWNGVDWQGAGDDMLLSSPSM